MDALRYDLNEEGALEPGVARDCRHPVSGITPCAREGRLTGADGKSAAALRRRLVAS
jgi:hypothetical protein